MFSSKTNCPPPMGGKGETSFTDSIKGHGFMLDETLGGDVRYDGGEDELEDDYAHSGETTLMGHSPGWTVFEKLYVFNGSFYVVT